MKRFAVIKDKICTNVIVLDPQQEYPLEEGEILLEDEFAGPGWVVQDGQLIDPTPVFEDPESPDEPSSGQPTVRGAQIL